MSSKLHRGAFGGGVPFRIRSGKPSPEIGDPSNQNENGGVSWVSREVV